MSRILNQQYALARLRAEIERKERRMCWGYKKFGHLVHNCRNKKEKAKRKPIP